MSNRTKNEQRQASLPPGMLPKAERRALGKQAAAKRARAKRRKKILNNLAAAGIVAVVIGVVVAAMLGAFDGGSSANPQATPSATATEGSGSPFPEGADERLKTKPTVTAGTGDVTELKATTLVEGTGAAVGSGQTITVNYVGVDYKTGKEFDSSWSSGQPASFDIGVGAVIKGWDQGLVGVKIGSRVQLDIPAELAYGENPTGGRPGGDLRFVVDILAAK